MHIFKNIWTYYWPVCILALLSLGLIFANIRIDGSWFLGWDSTTPEINLGLNFSRFLSGVWQEYRGLGTTDGMAHTSLIVHWMYSALLSILLPQELIRPILNILTMFVASWGTFVLTRFVLSSRQSTKLSPDQTQRITWISFISAMFVQFNLLTIQMYNMPLELFSFHFAVLPWTLWALSKHMRAPTKKSLLVLALITFAGASQAHVPTVFISYLLFVGVWILGFLLGKSWKQKLKSGSLAVLVILLINSFWLLPYSYAVVTKSSEISNAKQNRIGTPSVFYRNSVWGTAGSLFTFGGFQLDYNDWNSQTEEFEPIMQVWKAYWQAIPFKIGALLLSFLIVVGLVSNLAKKPKKWKDVELGPALGWLLCFFMLGTSIPVLGEVTALFREHIPLFAQIFRFTFTKFSLGYVIFSGVLLAFGIEFVVELLKQTRAPRKIHQATLFGCLLVIIMLLSLPIWGNLYYQRLFVQVPDSYFDFSTSLNKEHPTARYATFPMHSLWGWTTNTTEWGYRGSGFLWQLATQPMVDRAFDPWSKYNETLYLQMSQALYRQESDNFSELAKKYHLTHLLDDLSVFHPGNYTQALFRNEIPLFFASIANLTKEQHFDNLDLYSFAFPDNRTTEVFAPEKLQIIDSSYATAYTTRDIAYSQGGDYIQKAGGIEYPFSFLQLNEIGDVPPSVKVENNSISFSVPINREGNVAVPDFQEFTPVIPAVISLNTQFSSSQSAVEISPRLPTIVANDQAVFQPPKLLQTTPRSASVFVSINDRLIPLAKNAKPLTIELSTDEDNIITTYEGRPKIVEAVSLDSSEVDCAFLSNSFSAPLPQNLKCQTALLDLSKQDENSADNKSDRRLIGIELNTASATQTPPEICIVTSSKPDYCVNDPIHTTVSPQGENNSTTVVLPLQKNEEYLVYFLAAYTQGDFHNQVKYSDVVLQNYPLISAEKIDISPVVTSLQATLDRAIENEDQNISIIFPVQNEFSVYPRWENSKKSNYNCSAQGLGVVEKEVLPLEVSLMATAKGLLCDEIPLPDLLPEIEYLYSAQGKHLSGAGTKIFVTNPETKHLDLEIITPRGDFSLLSPVIQSRNTYQETTGIPNISYTTESFGVDTNKTVFTQQEFIPLPISWLSAIGLLPSGNIPIVNSAEITERGKIGTFYYSSLVKRDGEGVVTLPRSFDFGWIAFPGLRFWQQFEHVEYNGWANAWIIPAALNGESVEVRVTMLYWPQLLSYVGYGLLIVTLVWLGVGAWKQRKNPMRMNDNSISVDEDAESAMGSGDTGTSTTHFTPLSTEKLFTGGTLDTDWKLFQQEIRENTALIAKDVRSGWHKLQQAVRGILRGKAE